MLSYTTTRTEKVLVGKEKRKELGQPNKKVVE